MSLDEERNLPSERFTPCEPAGGARDDEYDRHSELLHALMLFLCQRGTRKVRGTIQG